MSGSRCETPEEPSGAPAVQVRMKIVQVLLFGFSFLDTFLELGEGSLMLKKKKKAVFFPPLNRQE